MHDNLQKSYSVIEEPNITTEMDQISSPPNFEGGTSYQSSNFLGGGSKQSLPQNE